MFLGITYNLLMIPPASNHLSTSFGYTLSVQIMTITIFLCECIKQMLYFNKNHNDAQRDIL